jgi:hypothetical protein
MAEAVAAVTPADDAPFEAEGNALRVPEGTDLVEW